MINLLVQFRLFKSEPPLLEVRQKKRGRGCLVRCALLAAYSRPKSGAFIQGAKGQGFSPSLLTLATYHDTLWLRRDLGRLTLTPANSSIAPPFASDKGYLGSLKVLRGGDSLSHLLAPHVPMRSDCQRRVCPALKCPTGLTYIRLVPKGICKRRCCREPPRSRQPSPSSLRLRVKDRFQHRLTANTFTTAVRRGIAMPPQSQRGATLIPVGGRLANPPHLTAEGLRETATPRPVLFVGGS